MREDAGTLQVRNDRCVFHPFGLFGGKSGRCARNIFNPDNGAENLPGKFTRTIRKGDVFRYEMAGAGGWGDPLERETWRVLKDVRNEYLSPEAALEDYGVVVDVKNWTIDEPATAAQRTKLRKQQSSRKTAVVDRGHIPDGFPLDRE